MFFCQNNFRSSSLKGPVNQLCIERCPLVNLDEKNLQRVLVPSCMTSTCLAGLPGSITYSYLWVQFTRELTKVGRIIKEYQGCLIDMWSLGEVLWKMPRKWPILGSLRVQHLTCKIPCVTVTTIQYTSGMLPDHLPWDALRHTVMIRVTTIDFTNFHQRSRGQCRLWGGIFRVSWTSYKHHINIIRASSYCIPVAQSHCSVQPKGTEDFTCVSQPWGCWMFDPSWRIWYTL